MSYCRWSTNNFNCDLYCYADCGGGYTTHVAGMRRRVWYRLFSWLTDKRWNAGTFKYRTGRFSPFLLPHRLTHKKIRLPETGKTFNDNTLEEFYERVKGLIGMGYKAPDSLLRIIKEEIEE